MPQATTRVLNNGVLLQRNLPAVNINQRPTLEPNLAYSKLTGKSVAEIEEAWRDTCWNHWLLKEPIPINQLQPTPGSLGGLINFWEKTDPVYPVMTHALGNETKKLLELIDEIRNDVSPKSLEDKAPLLLTALQSVTIHAKLVRGRLFEVAKIYNFPISNQHEKFNPNPLSLRGFVDQTLNCLTEDSENSSSELKLALGNLWYANNVDIEKDGEDSAFSFFDIRYSITNLVFSEMLGDPRPLCDLSGKVF